MAPAEREGAGAAGSDQPPKTGQGRPKFRLEAGIATRLAADSSLKEVAAGWSLVVGSDVAADGTWVVFRLL